MQVVNGGILWLRADASSLHPAAFMASGLSKEAQNHPVLVVDTLGGDGKTVWILLCSSKYHRKHGDIPLTTGNNLRLFKFGPHPIMCNACVSYHIPQPSNGRVPQPLTFKDPECSMRSFSHVKTGMVYEVSTELLRGYNDDMGKMPVLDEESLAEVRKKVDRRELERQSQALKASPRGKKRGEAGYPEGYRPLAMRTVAESEDGSEEPLKIQAGQPDVPRTPPRRIGSLSPVPALSTNSVNRQASMEDLIDFENDRDWVKVAKKQQPREAFTAIEDAPAMAAYEDEAYTEQEHPEPDIVDLAMAEVHPAGAAGAKQDQLGEAMIYIGLEQIDRAIEYWSKVRTKAEETIEALLRAKEAVK